MKKPEFKGIILIKTTQTECLIPFLETFREFCKGYIIWINAGQIEDNVEVIKPREEDREYIENLIKEFRDYK